MPRDVWFQLADAQGNAVGSVDRVKEVVDDAKVVDLRDAVKDKFKDLLAGIETLELAVFAVTRDGRKSLAPDSAIGSLGTSGDNALIVQAPLSNKRVHAESASWMQQFDALRSGSTVGACGTNDELSVGVPPSKPVRVETMLRVEHVEDVPQIDIKDAKYVTLPAPFLKKCGLRAENDVMLYCRDQVLDLWTFLQDEVIVNNGRGFVLGPPGTGKSLSTLSFVASLDHNEWNVVWIHLSKWEKTCLALGSKKYWIIETLERFELPRVAGKKLLICLDGYKATPEHERFLELVFTQLDKTNERLVVCTSLSALGKRNDEDDETANLQVFFMYSWTQDEYIAATADPAFYDKIKSKLDATSSNEVNEDDDDFDADWTEEQKKEHALGLKYFYAGGSCRFMFQYRTRDVIATLKWGLRCVGDTSDLVRYCRGNFHINGVDTLFGMQEDGSGYMMRYPVSSYAAFLCAMASDERTIAELMDCLNASNNPSLDGHLFDFLFLTAVQNRVVKLFGDQGVEDVLPQAQVLRFDANKRFGVVVDGKIKGAKRWLQPSQWNQGGYDAVYFDQDEGKVIFVQVTRSHKHDFKMRFFLNVLCKLKIAGMQIKQVVVYFVIKPTQLLHFKIAHIENRDHLVVFDERWTRPEEEHVRVRAFAAA